jgi:hypothetical protein
VEARLRTKPFAALVLASLISLRAGAADMQRLMAETQRMATEPHQVTIVWWVPTAFWDESLKKDTELTAEGKARTISVLDQYTVFFLASESIGPGGSVEAKSREDLINNSRLEIGGKLIAPLAPGDIKPGGQALLAVMKPILSNMLGPFGQGLQMVLYPSAQGDQRLLDPLKNGSFSFQLYDKSFKWRLPLGSLLPPMIDPQTNEEFPGDFLYNPYSGGKLRTK